MKKKKEIKKVQKKQKPTLVKEVSKVKKSVGAIPEGSFVCKHTGETILKKNCIVDKQKTRTVYFYGTKNETGYSKVYIEKIDNE